MLQIDIFRDVVFGLFAIIGTFLAIMETLRVIRLRFPDREERLMSDVFGSPNRFLTWYTLRLSFYFAGFFLIVSADVAAFRIGEASDVIESSETFAASTLELVVQEHTYSTRAYYLFSTLGALILMLVFLDGVKTLLAFVRKHFIWQIDSKIDFEDNFNRYICALIAFSLATVEWWLICSVGYLFFSVFTGSREMPLF